MSDNDWRETAQAVKEHIYDCEDYLNDEFGHTFPLDRNDAQVVRAWAMVDDLVAQVRQDERNRAVEAIETQWTVDPSWEGTNWNNALTAAMDAVRGKVDE